MSACRRHWRLDHGRHRRRLPRPPTGRRPLRRSRAQQVPSTKAELRPRSLLGHRLHGVRGRSHCGFALTRRRGCRARPNPGSFHCHAGDSSATGSDNVDKPLVPRNFRPTDQPWAFSEVKVHVGGDPANRRDRHVSHGGPAARIGGPSSLSNVRAPVYCSCLRQRDELGCTCSVAGVLGVRARRPGTRDWTNAQRQVGGSLAAPPTHEPSTAPVEHDCSLAGRLPRERETGVPHCRRAGDPARGRLNRSTPTSGAGR